MDVNIYIFRLLYLTSFHTTLISIYKHILLGVLKISRHVKKLEVYLLFIFHSIAKITEDKKTPDAHTVSAGVILE